MRSSGFPLPSCVSGKTLLRGSASNSVIEPNIYSYHCTTRERNGVSIVDLAQSGHLGASGRRRLARSTRARRGAEPTPPGGPQKRPYAPVGQGWMVEGMVVVKSVQGDLFGIAYSRRRVRTRG